jgi:tripartite-type tricarboxylate transporter receptor subunit TctC
VALAFIRTALGCALGAALTLPGHDLRAAEPYPSKPIRLVVPFAAGSATDSVGRLLAQELAQRLGQNVLVENRPGANGQLAAAFVAKSAPDGYTLFMTTNTTHSANPHLYRTLPYDPVHDFEPIVRNGTLPFMLVVTAGLPVTSTAQLVAYARSHPGTLAYAAANSTSLVGAQTINVLAGIDLLRVSYKSSPDAMLDLTAGRLQVMVADFVTAMPHVKAGKLTVLGVTTARRSALLPQVPPIADTLKGFDVTSWNGLFAPAGTPPPILARVSGEMLAIVGRPQVRDRLAALGFEVDPLGPEAFERYVREQAAYWGKLVRAARIEPE